ncbi:MAG TPA: hypothetical protein P5244_13230, partial [Syntrophales bacterium]|nr:hypothetical protein [Syntrophales bacterium]
LVEHRGGCVEPHRMESVVGEDAGEIPCPAPQVQNPPVAALFQEADQVPAEIAEEPVQRFPQEGEKGAMGR